MKINLCSLYLISFVPFGNHGNKALSTEASPDLIPDLIFRGIWMWGTRKPSAPRVEALALRDTGLVFSSWQVRLGVQCSWLFDTYT